MILMEIGQCGIQVGQPLNGLLPQRQFQPLLLDTERKTLQGPHGIKLDSSGRGNNWAHGYSESISLDYFRNCVEKQARFKGACFLHSVAGGTGSGLGSRLLQDIRDEYPKACLISFPILPFVSGETAVQHYNQTLSLSWMQRYSDMICFFSNDQLYHSVSKQLQLYNSKLSQVKLQDLNECISQALAGLFLPQTPVCHNELSQKLSIAPMKYFDPWDIIESVTPIPDMKMAQLYSSRLINNASSEKLESNASWDDTMTSLLRNMQYPAMDPFRFKSKALFSRLYIRGIQTKDFFTKYVHSLPKKLEQRTSAVILGSGIDCHYSYLHDADPKCKLKSLTHLTNTTAPIDLIDFLLEKVSMKMNAKAYLHWYERYIPDIRSELIESCEILQTVRMAYSTV